MKSVTIRMPGEPVACARARVTRHGTYTPKETREFQTALRLTAMAAMRQADLRMFEDTPVVVWLTVNRSVPTSWSERRRQLALDGLLRPTPRPDLDNYIKAVWDALKGVVWKDDSLVCSEHSAKWYSATPGITITISEIEHEESQP